MIVNTYADSIATSGYYKNHAKFSRFKDKKVILVEFRAYTHLKNLLENHLTAKEKNEINLGQKYLVLNCSTEADRTLDNIKNNLNLNPNFIKVVGASPDLQHDELYLHFERLSQTTLNCNPTSPLRGNPNKLYVNFNLKVRPHRLATLALLHEYNLLDKGYNSFYCDHLEWSEQIDKITNQFSINTVFPTDILPLKLDSINLQQNAAHIKFSQIQEYIEDSLISLVTETNYFSHEPRFLTEKTFKPIALKQPFILVTVPKTLEYLRKIGYKTFQGIINENYDTELNDQKRLTMIMEELKRLSMLSGTELNLFKTKCLEIVEYNFELFKNRKIFIH